MQKVQVSKNIENMKAPQFGEDMHLTLDARLQFFAHRALKEAIDTHQAKSGSVILLHVDTGSILALVNAPTFDPEQTSYSQRFKSTQLGCHESRGTRIHC